MTAISSMTASATALLQLAATGNAIVLLTLTLRSTAPDAVTALWKDGAATRVELQALSRLETDALVTELLGGACDTLTLERIWHTTEGNPLYAKELLDAAKACGRLSRYRDRWKLDEGGELTGRLVELVEARIERLEPAVRRVLELVALAAPVTLPVLEAVADLDAVAAAEESGLVEVIEDRSRTVARTTHPMHAEVVRSVLPGARRRLLCRQLADAIEATGLRRRDDVLRFLNWRLAAGESAPIELLVRGAWQATGADDMRLAERLARRRRDRSHPRCGAPRARRCDLSPVPIPRCARGTSRKYRRRRSRPHRGDHRPGESAVGSRSPRRRRDHSARCRIDDHRSPLSRMGPGLPRDGARRVPAFRPRASRSHSRSPTTPPTGHAPPRRAWDR